MGKVKTQPQYQKVADVVDHFNGFKRDKYWQNFHNPGGFLID